MNHWEKSKDEHVRLRERQKKTGNDVVESLSDPTTAKDRRNESQKDNLNHCIITTKRECE